MWAKRDLGLSSSGSKDYGTHNCPIFPDWNFVLFQSGENIVFLSLWCKKLKGPRELMRIIERKVR